ncbi:hypothetical protein FRC15_009732 [Serendipita sp. 397]|nr:hypothetical protein FRC15_009732 [Serendipita sp. 397]
MVLPIFRPILMKNHFASSERYAYFERLLYAQISQQLDQDPAEFQVDDALPFLDAYLHDIAIAVVDRHVNSSGDLRISSQLHEAACELLLQVATSVPLYNKELESSLLVDALIVNSHFKNEAITAVLNMAITSSKATEILGATQSVIQSSFGSRKSPSETMSLLHRTVLINALILDSGNEHILDAFASPNPELLIFLAQIYNVMLPSISKSLPGSVDTATWGTSWLNIKISILDSLHAALTYSMTGNGGISRCCDIMLSLIEKSPAPPDNANALVDATLPMDYQRLFKFSSTLLKLVPQSNEPKLQRLESILESYNTMTLVNPSIINHLGLGLDSMSATKRDIEESAKIVDMKGKGVDRRQVEEDASVDIAISQVLDILPDQDPQFLRRCLLHPTYKGEDGTERLITGLLEGSIPIDISAESDGKLTPTNVDSGIETAYNRRNIFDGQTIDLSSLRLGKKQSDVDDLLQDKTWLQEMKADILRRAEAASEDEDEGPSRLRRTKRDIVYVDDEFEDLDGLTENVSVIGDGETSDGNGDDEQNNSIETILELAYIENPKLFDRDSATRKSDARAKLITKTGWSHEQLEGWRIMLDRNPRKLKILQKHEFKGNKPLLQPNDKPEREETRKEGKGRGDSGRGGGGGRGRGRGRGAAQQGSDGSKGDANRERMWKERSGNRQRQRGHDKKFTCGGAPDA